MHRKLLGEKHVNIEDIEVKTNSRISFPGSESGSDVVTIYGPEQQIENAQTRLLVCVVLILLAAMLTLGFVIGSRSLRRRAHFPSKRRASSYLQDT